MPDLSVEWLPRLHSQRLPGLDLGEQCVHPDYNGLSILNLPASVCQWLGAPVLAGEPLKGAFLGSLSERRFQRVILLVVDALALLRLQSWIEAGITPALGELVDQGRLAPLTSITPSTTAAALTTLWTGRSPAEHGIAGYELWLKEYGLIANTIHQAAASYQNDQAGLQRAGFDPRTFLGLPTLGSHLRSYGIRTHVLQHTSILNSGLSSMLYQDVAAHRFNTVSDLWVNLRSLLERPEKERSYVYIYWGELDTLSHMYGPDDERTAAELHSFSVAMQRLFLARLSPTARKDTLLLLSADHGAVSTQPDPHYDLRNHPSLTRRLHMLPSGENRLAYLFIRPGQVEAVREYVERTWPGQFVLVESAYAAECGLFGPGQPHPMLLDRLGDYIVIGRGQAYLWWANKSNSLFGRHGGLDPLEMLVPFLMVEL